MEQMELGLPPLLDLQTESEIAALRAALAAEQQLNGELAAAVAFYRDDAQLRVAADSR